MSFIGPGVMREPGEGKALAAMGAQLSLEVDGDVEPAEFPDHG